MTKCKPGGDETRAPSHTKILRKEMTNVALPDDFCLRIRGQRVDADQFLGAIGGAPCVSLRLNIRKAASLGDSLPVAGVVPWCAEGRYLDERLAFTMMPQFHAGAFYVQEASSMSVSVALDVAGRHLPPSPVCLDLCAAPGGKATLMAGRLGGGGVIVANEVVRQRAWVLRENMAKWGCPAVVVSNKTPAAIAASGLKFDLVAVDAPCSGEGMFRKDPDAVGEWSPRAAADCAVRQRAILGDIWPALKPGGFLVYSTCTFNPDENERVVEWIAGSLGAEVVPLPMPQGCGVETLATAAGEAYAFYPHKVRGEGFFLCLLRKAGEACAAGRRLSGRGGKPAQLFTKSAVGADMVDGLEVYAKDGVLVGLPRDRAAQMVAAACALQPLMCGTPVGSVLSKRGRVDFAPAPELPLSWAYAGAALPDMELSLADALKFLHGDADIPLCQSAEAWSTVSYDGLRLGLVKRVGGRVNNYYPKEWRIRRSVVSPGA